MSVDTLSIARDLRAANLPTEQAEAIAAAIGISILDNTATKSDIVMLKADVAQVEAQLQSKIEKLDISIDGKLDRLKVEMFRWFLASTITIIGAVIAVSKLM